MRPLEKSVPVLSIRIPPSEDDDDDISDNESDGSVDLVEWFDEADPDWERNLQVTTMFWSFTVLVRLPENLYHKLIMDTYVLDKVRERILEKILWKNTVKFEIY